MNKEETQQLVKKVKLLESQLQKQRDKNKSLLAKKQSQHKEIRSLKSKLETSNRKSHQIITGGSVKKKMIDLLSSLQ